MHESCLKLGHSPDPDDAFMFYGLAKDKFPTGGYRFEHVLEDIQTLNQRAMKGELEITAISIHAYPYVADKYALTSCGSSMGDKYGPMIVARSPMKLQDLRGKTIAIPGELTTAFLALQLAMCKGAAKSEIRNPKSETIEKSAIGNGQSAMGNRQFGYVVVPFDQIQTFVRDGNAD